MAGPSWSSASTVAAAASSRWMNDIMPPPSPMTGRCRLRAAVTSASGLGLQPPHEPRSGVGGGVDRVKCRDELGQDRTVQRRPEPADIHLSQHVIHPAMVSQPPDRKSTRLNSSHLGISYAVFC